MRLILIGPPGSGKGTQAKLLSDKLGLEHISTGDILREEMAKGTSLGGRAKSFVLSGKLVPDDLVNEMVAERFRSRPAKFVMDGYPRTLPQAASFEQALLQLFLDLNGVVLLKVNDDEIVKRLSGRWICPQCKVPYHVQKNPPKVPGTCDVCSVALTQREDDKEETVRNRLKVYHLQTAELIDHYRRGGLLREVVGKGDIQDIHQKILQVLNVRGPAEHGSG